MIYDSIHFLKMDKIVWRHSLPILAEFHHLFICSPKKKMKNLKFYFLKRRRRRRTLFSSIISSFLYIVLVLLNKTRQNGTQEKKLVNWILFACFHSTSSFLLVPNGTPKILFVIIKCVCVCVFGPNKKCYEIR